MWQLQYYAFKNINFILFFSNICSLQNFFNFFSFYSLTIKSQTNQSDPYKTKYTKISNMWCDVCICMREIRNIIFIIYFDQSIKKTKYLWNFFVVLEMYVQNSLKMLCYFLLMTTILIPNKEFLLFVSRYWCDKCFRHAFSENDVKENYFF